MCYTRLRRGLWSRLTITVQEGVACAGGVYPSMDRPVFRHSSIVMPTIKYPVNEVNINILDQVRRPGRMRSSGSRFDKRQRPEFCRRRELNCDVNGFSFLLQLFHFVSAVTPRCKIHSCVVLGSRNEMTLLSIAFDVHLSIDIFPFLFFFSLQKADRSADK